MMRERSGCGPGAQLHAGGPLLAPDPEVPHWRGADGSRLSFSSLRCGLDPAGWGELREAHLAAIRRIAAAALAAAERRDGGETARLATAAARLCGEIRGLWPPSAVETGET
jgi:hypothetical protein